MPTSADLALEVRVRGRVQGVGFRPNVCRLARELGVSGQVRNDGEGVLIRASGPRAAMAAFVERMASEAPALARIEQIETAPLPEPLERGFHIVPSLSGPVCTQIAPDAAICLACRREVLNPAEPRFRYPFTTCTQCGPRLSVARAIPYERATTTLATFALCPLCAAQYDDGADRRFHAEGIACPACGPQTKLTRADGAPLPPEDGAVHDALENAARLLAGGAIVAIKGLGGYQLACDATQPEAVSRLRERKRRAAKPFALMARDLDVIRRYCAISDEEQRLLTSPAGPIVLLAARAGVAAPQLSAAVAPGQRSLGFMLPTTPLHVLLFSGLDRPLIMTSGNLAECPPLLDDMEAKQRLGPIADCFLSHDRGIAHRVDDSLVRVMAGRARVLRRARGYAPAPIRLPAGFETAPPLLAYGGELKASFCLLAQGEALLAPHLGDLDEQDSLAGYQQALEEYAQLFQHRPLALAADLHPDYATSQLAAANSGRSGLPLFRIQHHHAHAAACLVENAWPLDGAPVLAIVLDGLGLGDDGALWGGEFLWLDYRSSQRLASLKPVALIGGDRAAREPWRNLYAHLSAALGRRELSARGGPSALLQRLRQKPLPVVDRMLELELNSPRASSCGRLFDAVAAALDLAFDSQLYEGQAAAQLEAIADPQNLNAEDLGYPFDLVRLDGSDLLQLEPAPMWRTLLRELAEQTPPALIAARFHRGLAQALVRTARALSAERTFDTVVLSGGCFQNRVLLEETLRQLHGAGFTALTPAEVPPNDGGLSLGQAAIAAARAIESSRSGATHA